MFDIKGKQDDQEDEEKVFNRLDNQQDIYLPVKNSFNVIEAVKPMDIRWRSELEMRSEESLMLYL